MSIIYPAATVVLIRDGDNGLETLLLRRSDKLKFASGNWVFPGGRIDPADFGDNPEDIEAAARQGAVRETLEETGLSINDQGMVYFAHWTTPPKNTRRFATWFFIRDITGQRANVTVDGGEIVAHRWCTPGEALNDHQSEILDMLPPTFITLTELAACSTATAALTKFSEQEVTTFLPRFTRTDQGVMVLYPGDSGYEEGDHNAEGNRHRLMMFDRPWRYEQSS